MSQHNLRSALERYIEEKHYVGIMPLSVDDRDYEDPENNILEDYAEGILALAELQFRIDPETGNAVADMGSIDIPGSLIEQTILGIAEYNGIDFQPHETTRAMVTRAFGKGSVGYLESEAARIMRERILPQFSEMMGNPLMALNTHPFLDLDQLEGQQFGGIEVNILPSERREHDAYLATLAGRKWEPLLDEHFGRLVVHATEVENLRRLGFSVHAMEGPSASAVENPQAIQVDPPQRITAK